MLETLMEMVKLFQQLWTTLGQVAPDAVVKALVVFLSVFTLRLLTVVPTSNWARAANLVLSTLLSGILAGSVRPEEVYLLALTSTFAATIWEVFVKLWEFIGNRVYRHLPALFTEE